MIVKIEDTIRGVFGTTTFTTGAATNADSTPTCVVLEQGAAMGYAPTVTNIATGLYEVAVNCTAANGFEVGKEYTLYVVVIMATVTVRGPVSGISSFIVRTNSVDTIASASASATAAFVNDVNAPANAQTIQQQLNIITSAVTASGADLDSDGAVAIRNTANTKDRIVGTVSGGTRTLTTLDGTP